jgi:hypothetical protein
MAHISFTPNLRRHVSCPPATVTGHTVHEALVEVFRDNPRLAGYVLDDRGALRRHMLMFVDGEPLRDRRALSDPLAPDSEILVMQALTGG